MTFGESIAEAEGEGVPSWLKDLAPPAEAGEPEGELTPPVEEHTGVTGWLHEVSTPAVVAGAAVVASQLPEKDAEETPQEIPFELGCTGGRRSRSVGGREYACASR